MHIHLDNPYFVSLICIRILCHFIISKSFNVKQNDHHKNTFTISTIKIEKEKTAKCEKRKENF